MIILNEKEYAKECLKNKTIGEKPFFTLTILAKYYYHCFGYRKKKITDLLIDFMSKYYPRYDCNKSSWDENIEKIAKNAGKYALYEIDGVWITECELETIDNIHNKVLERLAFTLLCIAKLNCIKNPKNNGWVNTETKELFSLARISCSVDDRYCKLNALNQLLLLEFPKKNDNLSVRVTYINDDSPKKLFISDFRELGYEYLKYKGENFIRCRECGILIRNNKSNTKKYCKQCSGYIPQDVKTVVCVDCGKEFEVSPKNNSSYRCAECQKKFYNKEMRIKMANRKLSNKSMVHLRYGAGTLYYTDSLNYHDGIDIDDMYILCDLEGLDIYREFENFEVNIVNDTINENIPLETQIDCDLGNVCLNDLPTYVCLVYKTHNNKGDDISIYAPKCKIAYRRNHHLFICTKYDKNGSLCYIKGENS